MVETTMATMETGDSLGQKVTTEESDGYAGKEYNLSTKSSVSQVTRKNQGISRQDTDSLSFQHPNAGCGHGPKSGANDEDAVIASLVSQVSCLRDILAAVASESQCKQQQQCG